MSFVPNPLRTLHKTVNTFTRKELRDALPVVDSLGSSSRQFGEMRRKGRYEVKGPNRVWSVDGHDKLSRFGFQIYGSIDAYSRCIMWCFVGHSNRTAVSVASQYLEAIQRIGFIPKLIRSDKGTETILVCYYHVALRRVMHMLGNSLPFKRAWSYGKSTQNQRIEGWWNILQNAQTQTYRDMFEELESLGFFDGSETDVVCLQFIYMDMIREHIHGFVRVHNSHRIRRQSKRAHYLPTGRPLELWSYPKEGVRIYGDEIDYELHNHFKQQLRDFDPDAYIEESTKQLFILILQQGGYPTIFSFNDNHREAYCYLRERVNDFVMQGNSIDILQKPRGSHTWIEHKERVEIRLNRKRAQMWGTETDQDLREQMGFDREEYDIIENGELEEEIIFQGEQGYIQHMRIKDTDDETETEYVNAEVEDEEEYVEDVYLREEKQEEDSNLDDGWVLDVGN